MIPATLRGRTLSALLISSALACHQHPSPPLPKRADIPRPPAALDSMVAAARRRILADTASPAFRELDLMSAPISTRPVSAIPGDSLLWTMPKDSCALLVVARRNNPNGGAPDNGTFFAAEWYGNGGFGQVSEIAPDPDWTWMAYGRRGSRSDTAAGPNAIREDDKPQAIIEHLVDPCAGEDCQRETVSRVPVAWRVAWTADGIALFAGRELPAEWIPVDPQTRAPTERQTDAPIAPVWARRAVSDPVRPRGALRSAGGDYVFSVRHDSIMVSGPDRNGIRKTRVVGQGVPVAATRNGQYLLAVRRNANGFEPVVYYFVLFHAMLHSSCDR